MLKKIRKQSGFTLIEILMAIGVFSLLIALSTTIYVNITREQRRIDIQNAIYEDTRLMLERISAQARQHAIDYEEYYSQLVVQKQPASSTADKIYGINYGKYGSRFYDPGLTLNGVAPTNPEDLGAECGDGSALEDAPNEDCIIYIPSLDLNIGQNPYDANDPTTATAFCDGDCSSPNFHVQPELYLISKDASRKIIFAREITKLNSQNQAEYTLGMVELIGKDTDANGVVDHYECDELKGFNCPAANNLPSSGDLKLGTEIPSLNDFVPISSSKVTVKDLKFIISPLEDPHKAFDEKTADVQIQPHVTIILTVEATEEAKNKVNFLQNPELTLQTTITPRIYGEVKSFPPLKSMKKFKETF